MKNSREIVKQNPDEGVELERPFDSNLPEPSGNYPMYQGVAIQEQNPLFEYWKAIRKRLWLVIGITVLLTTLAAIYMARKPNVYLAQAIVQVDKEDANQELVASDRPVRSGGNDPAYFNTQLQLLNSNSLIRRTIKELSLDSNAEFQKEKNNKSVSPLRAVLSAIGLTNSGKKVSDETIEEVSLNEETDLVSSDEIEDAIRLAPYVELIKLNLNVDPIRESRAQFKQTRLISIAYRHTSPTLAAYVVNGIARTYSVNNEEKRTGTGKKTIGFLQERIANLQTDVKNGENRLVQLKSGAGILKTDSESTLVVDRLSGLNKQLLEAEEDRKNTEAQYNAIKNSPDRLNALVNEKMAAFLAEKETALRRFINDNKKTIAQLKAQKQKLLVQYVESAPEITEIDRQINTLEAANQDVTNKNETGIKQYRRRTANSLLLNARTRYIAARDKENKIRSDYNSQYNEAQGQNLSGVKIKILEQEIETKKGFLENLNKQMEGTDVVLAGTDNNISVTEFAIPPEKAISPRRLTSVMAVMMLSLLFGAGLALFLEYLDDSIKSTEEVENYLMLPALAAIPAIESAPKRRLLLVGASNLEQTDENRQMLITKDSRSSMSEAYRQLRTSILLSTAGHAPKSLLITSSLPAEGKTTTAINTAISLAQTGADVLVIDADMRRPRLHSVFGVSNAEGLSTILSSEIEKENTLDIIQKDEESNLFLLTSGPVPPNPAELLGAEQMRDLIDLLEEEFTHIVIDSPPIASFTDGVLIASLVDGAILVVHSGKSSRQVVHRSRQLLQDVGSKIFGVVLNNVNLKASDNSYYYQSYYHRDSYNYDEEEEE